MTDFGFGQRQSQGVEQSQGFTWSDALGHSQGITWSETLTVLWERL